MKPFFSIIMASTLSEYKNCASNREMKLIRSIESVLAQTFTQWELIIVADGCVKTFEMVKEKYIDDGRINCVVLDRNDKASVWQNVNNCRNYGKSSADGLFCLYLDNDDILGTEHLQKIFDGINRTTNSAAFFFDDMVMDQQSVPHQRKCKIQRGKCGTSNICFDKTLPVYWRDSTYLHDWRFIQELMKHKIAEIGQAEYIVCHIPDPRKKLDL